jgi:hypothetical protein
MNGYLLFERTAHEYKVRFFKQFASAYGAYEEALKGYLDAEGEDYPESSNIKELEGIAHPRMGFEGDEIYLKEIVFEDEPAREFFPITSVCRDDLEDRGFDASGVTDAQMETLASKMANVYMEGDYWVSLDILAEDYLGLERTEKVDDDEEDDEVV